MLENKLFDKDIYELYDMDIKDTYELISNNTNYLDNISIDDVLDIKFSCYQDVIILLNNGNVIVNGEERYNNIKSLAFMSGLVIVALNGNKEIKVFGTLVDYAVDYKNYFDVGDILCIDEEVIVVKGDKKINLFSNEEWGEE